MSSKSKKSKKIDDGVCRCSVSVSCQCQDVSCQCQLSMSGVNVKVDGQNQAGRPARSSLLLQFGCCDARTRTGTGTLAPLARDDTRRDAHTARAARAARRLLERGKGRRGSRSERVLGRAGRAQAPGHGTSASAGPERGRARAGAAPARRARVVNGCVYWRRPARPSILSLTFSAACTLSSTRRAPVFFISSA